MAKGRDERGDQPPGLRATIPSHSGFVAGDGPGFRDSVSFIFNRERTRHEDVSPAASRGPIVDFN
jgi:hypothetical protein